MYNAVVPAANAIDASAATAAVPAAAPAAAAVAVAAPVAAPAAAAPAKNWDGVERRTDTKPAAAAPAKDESIRIDAVKLDALLEVAGESVQAANQAA
ncbi:Signal transducing histidine kinase, homodimeric domain, partial [Friedmanniomyces endolithicus]